MDVFQSYTYGTAGWFALQAMLLILSPRLIISFLSTEIREPTVLEVYFSRSLGMALFSLGVITLLLTGSIPLTSSFSDTTASSSKDDPKASYAIPTVIASMVYHSATAMYTYGWYSSFDGTAAHMLGCWGSAVLAIMALWIVLFGTGGGSISRKTGADKRTSNFPFGNKESASARKKQWGKAI